MRRLLLALGTTAGSGFPIFGRAYPSMEIPTAAPSSVSVSASSRSAIHVTRTFLPPEEEYMVWLRKAYGAHMLTNQGPIHQELEERLRVRFDVPHLRLMANGTLAIQLAIRALGVKG